MNTKQSAGLRKRPNGWEATVTVSSGQRFALGVFKRKADAIAARDAAKEAYGLKRERNYDNEHATG